jgi:protein phosphatase
VADAKERCGTTIVGLWAPHGAASPATVFHVGDSRMYLLRKNAGLEALTRDHSAYQQWVDSGRRGSPPPKSYILQALGLSDVAPDIISIDVAAGDRFLLCTDGLSNGVAPAEMQDVMAESASLETACERFISLGLARGGNDNLTSVVGAFS